MNPTPLDLPFLRTSERGQTPMCSPGVTPSMDEALRLVEIHRNTECAAYDQCLMIAIRSDWKGWSCQQCPRKEAPKQLTDS